MNCWMDHIQILKGGSLGISNDLIKFWDESIKNKMAEGEHPKNKLHGGGNFFTNIVLLWQSLQV